MTTETLEMLTETVDAEQQSTGPKLPAEIHISPEDLGMISRSNSSIRTALQELGFGYRRLSAMKAEAETLIAKEEAKILELVTAVSDAERVFNTLTKATATKYDIDLNLKVNIDLTRGVFQVG